MSTPNLIVDMKKSITRITVVPRPWEPHTYGTEYDVGLDFDCGISLTVEIQRRWGGRGRKPRSPWARRQIVWLPLPPHVKLRWTYGERQEAERRIRIACNRYEEEQRKAAERGRLTKRLAELHAQAAELPQQIAATDAALRALGEGPSTPPSPPPDTKSTCPAPAFTFKNPFEPPASELPSADLEQASTDHRVH